MTRKGNDDLHTNSCYRDTMYYQRKDTCYSDIAFFRCETRIVIGHHADDIRSEAMVLVWESTRITIIDGG